MKSTVEKISIEIKHLPIFILVPIITILSFRSKHDLAFADQEHLQAIRSEPIDPEVKKTDEEYHTPLAGEPLNLEFMGRSIDIPARDRGNQNSLELRGILYTPDITDANLIPMLALYIKRTWERARICSRDDINKASIPRKKGGVKALSSLMGLFHVPPVSDWLIDWFLPPADEYVRPQTDYNR